MSIVGSWASESAHNVIIGAPKGFNLKEHISKATRIQMAVAFMKYKGLEDFLSIIDPSKIQMEVLVGPGSPTELEALETLKSLKENFKRHDFKVVIPSESGIFHPKLLIVKTPELHFALVGSANCTPGGHRSNCECTMYVNTPETLADIEKWFDSLMKSELAAFIAGSLTQNLINLKAKYTSKKGKANRDRSRREDEKLVAEIKKEFAKQDEIRKWNKFVETANQYLMEDEYPKEKKERQDAVDKIKQALHYPSFEGITRTDWDRFFKIHELGTLKRMPRDKLYKKIDRISETFRNLIDDSISLSDRINSALSVKGFGPNIVTKILTVHNPDKYPTWNKPVDESLSDFGLELPRTSDNGRKYTAIQKKMKKLIGESKLKEMLDLDAFFVWYYNKIKDKSKEKNRGI